MLPHQRMLLLLLSLGMTLTLVSLVRGGVVTSSARIQALYRTEDILLRRLHTFLSNARSDLQQDEESEDDEISEREEFLEHLQHFYDVARRNHSVESQSSRVKAVQHPNGAFKTIQNFALNWFLLRKNATRNEQDLLSVLDFGNHPYADMSDYRAACLAMVRLQMVYELSVEDMMEGRYEKYTGPPLSPTDAYDIGSEALSLGYPDSAILWLRAAVDATEDTEDPGGINVASALAKLGVAHVALGDWIAAAKALQEAEEVDSSDDDVFKLRMRVRSRDDTGLSVYWADYLGSPKIYEEWFSNFTRLCRRKTPLDVLKKHHFCRYKCTGIPILRFKEMILSLKPYASIFYDIISPREADHMTRKAYNGLYQGEVGISGSRKDYQSRTSDLNFLSDSVSNIVARVSRRVALASGLDTATRYPGDFDSSEPFQTVNYGIGGHYSGHMDPFEGSPRPANMHATADRMATFLLYLTHVERGGSTVFTSVDLAVPPIQYGALFWYNFTPDGKLDPLTFHAGCPVMVGEKWVSNKWIWHYGNEFRRPCARKPNQSQWSVERLLHTTC